MRLGHAVSRITWGRPGGVTIACRNGATVEADAAIVTVSLGVLKAQHGTLFDPPLPPAKQAALERLQIGTVDKLFLDFTPPGMPAGTSSTRQSSSSGSSSSGGSEGPVVSYALLWAGPWDAAASGKEHAAGSRAAAPATSEDEAQLPEWARGVFSLRFGGPEVKRCQQAADQQQPVGAHGVGDGTEQQQQQQQQQHELQPEEEPAESEFSPCSEAAQPTCYQAVAWVTGAAAAAMEAASDEQVLAALRQLATLFPQLQLPPGASWDAVELHR